jgi:hypothetical protein
MIKVGKKIKDNKYLGIQECLSPPLVSLLDILTESKISIRMSQNMDVQTLLGAGHAHNTDFLVGIT